MTRTLLALTLIPSLAPAADGPEFTLETDARVSLGVFDKKSGALVRTLASAERLPAGNHTVPWDGLDNRARPVPAGDYEWRLLTSPGFTARYLTTVGIDPPGGEHPVPRMFTPTVA